METTPQCPLISTDRLRPFRQRLKRIIMTITDSGYVSMETISHLTNQPNSPEIAKELFHISPDGMQIEVYKNAEGVAAIDGCPVLSQPYKTYTYPHLAAKERKKYQHAHKFVEIVKSKTAKVILVTDKARCSLMENSPQPDFQVSFMHGVRILMSKSKITVTDQNKGSLTFDATSVGSRVSPDTLDMVEYAKQCLTQCLKIENSVNSLQARNPSQSLFPVTVGTISKPFLLSSSLSSLQFHASQDTTQSLTGEITISSQNSNTKLPPISQTETRIAFSQSQDFSCKERTHNQNNRSYKYEPGLFNNAVCKSVVDHEVLHSEDEIRGLLLAKSAQFGGSSCSSKVKSSSTSTTPQKINFKVNCHADHESTQILHQQNVHFNMHSLTSCNGYFQHCDHVLLEQHEKSKLNLNKDTADQLQVACNVPQAYGPDLLSDNNCDTDCHRVSFSPHCLTETCDTSCHDQAENELSNPSYLFQNGYITPKRSSQPFPSDFQFYSADSIKHRQHHKKNDRHNLTIGPDETALQNVRRNLFSDEILKEPIPVCGPHVLIQDKLALRPTPSLELSVCCNLEHSTLALPPAIGQNTKPDRTEICLASQLADTCTLASAPSSENNAPSLTPLQARSNHYPESSPRDSEFFPLSISANDAQTSCTADQPFKLLADDVHFVGSTSENTNISASNIPDKLPVSLHTANGLQSQMNASPKKPVPVRKVAPLSPLKASAMQIEESDNPKSPLAKHAESTAMDTYQYKHPSLKKEYKQNASFNSGLGHASSTSLEISNHIAKSREALIHTRSDPGAYRKSAVAFSNLPVSPQKEFLRFSIATSDHCGLDLTLPPHVWNSLDMSVSSYYSDSPSSSRSSGCDPIHQIFVPYTGWASLYANGAVWVLYNDGTQLGIKSTEAAMIYIDQDGSQTKYKNSDVVSDIVKLKLEKLPKIIDLLMKSPPMTSLDSPL